MSGKNCIIIIITINNAVFKRLLNRSNNGEKNAFNVWKLLKYVYERKVFRAVY